MRTLTFDLPDTVEIGVHEARIILAGELYERQKISLGQAAEVAGLSYRAFVEIMGFYGFSIFNYSEADLLNELRHA